MNSFFSRRSLGLLTGVALLFVGAAELWISKADFESTRTQAYCNLGLCAAQFTPERVFEIGQMATLGDAKAELADFRRAVQLSPASAYRWADLGEAEFAVRDYVQAKYAFDQALKAGPRSPVILMRSANLYFQIGDSAMVLRQLAKVLSDPGLSEYYDAAFLTCSRLGIPVADMFKRGIPQRKEVLSSMLTFWTKLNKTDEAVATWQWASQRSLVDGESMGRFFRFMIQADRQSAAQEAQDLWTSYVGRREPEYRVSNWIYNAGFERDPSDSPFDWAIEPRQDVQVVREQVVPNGSEWALRIRFNGETNTAYHQTYQDMVLAPGKYQFSVMMKTEQLTTDEGVRLHIFDWPTQAKLNIWTDTLTGSHGWTKFGKTFEVPTGVKVVRVEVARMSSAMFDNKIGGTAWLNGLVLRPN